MSSMINLFKTTFNTQYLNVVLLLVRVTTGAYMLTHGIPKLMKFFSTGDITFSDPLGVGTIPSLMMAIFAEVFCSILLIFGFGTRLVVIPLMITMIVAVIFVHGADPFGKKELALMYLNVFVILLVAGAGKYSLDKWIYDRNARKNLNGDVIS